VRYVVHAVKNDLGDTCDNATINATDFMDVRGIERNDLDLVKVVEDLGEEANGQFADLDIIEIPDNVNWEIDNYDGMEHVDEVC
jgi:ATP-dependent Zn protease